MNENEFAAQAQFLKAGLYRTAYLYLGSESAAIDAVDEAVFKGLLSFKKLRQPEFFKTWMTRILINECKTELKRRARSQSYAELPEVATEDFDALPLRDAISRLPETLREPLILRYFSGYTTAETAAILSIPQGTAAPRLRRALELLRRALSEDETAYEPK